MNFSKEPYIKVQDFSVTGESFELLLDVETQLLKTYPQPSEENLFKYYESEDYISHTDAKRSLFEKIYQIVKKKAVKDKVNLINFCNGDKGKLLDIGTGTGDFLVEAKKKHWKTYGIEPNPKAKEIAKGKGLSLVDDTEVFDDGFFDVITMWHVLEHVSNLDKQLAELKRLLKPTGTIIIAVPNYKSFDAKYYGKYWAAYDVPRHLWHFSKTAITKLFDRVHLKVIRIQPLWFDSFYVSMLSEKYKSGKVNYLKALYIGLQSNIRGNTKKEYSSHIYIIQNN